MKVVESSSKHELGQSAAKQAAAAIRSAVKEKGFANIIVATGTSQFEMLEQLVMERAVPWSKVTAFHLDEYVGMPITHNASFRKYLWERFVSQLALPLAAFHYIDGEGDAIAECKRLEQIIQRHPIDIAFVGIGKNAHLAFNDPPADFETEKSYLVVNLDEACRRQQMGEGWFPTLNDVPKQAISMSCKQILKSKAIIASVPDARKAKAVQVCIEGSVSPKVPASILQKHADTTIYLDVASASLLRRLDLRGG